MGLQSLIDAQENAGKLQLPPGEFFGQVTIDRAITIVGQGKSTWIGSRSSPTVKVTVSGVKLQNLILEQVGSADGIAIEADPGTEPVLENVLVRGWTSGDLIMSASSPEKAVEEEVARISFLPPPPISSGLEAGSQEVLSPPTILAAMPQLVADQRLLSLLRMAMEAKEREDWPTALKVYEDMLTLCLGQEEFEKHSQAASSQAAASRPFTGPMGQPLAQGVSQISGSAKDTQPAFVRPNLNSYSSKLKARCAMIAIVSSVMCAMWPLLNSFVGSPAPPLLFIWLFVAMLLGTVACCGLFYAKRRDPAAGAILGLLPVIGPAIALALPDKRTTGR